MKKPTTSLCENNEADQLLSNCEADQPLCFRYTDSKIPLLSKSKIASNLLLGGGRGGGGREREGYSPILSDLVGKPNCRLSHAHAQIISWHEFLPDFRQTMHCQCTPRTVLFSALHSPSALAVTDLVHPLD